MILEIKLYTYTSLSTTLDHKDDGNNSTRHHTRLNNKHQQVVYVVKNQI